MFCWTRDITVWKSAWMTSAQLWSRRHHWPWADVIRADVQTVISRYLHNVNTRIFCTADTMFRTIIMQNSQADRRGFNRPILRPLWLMTSAAAGVISVPSVLNDRVGSLMTVSPYKWRYSIPAYECHSTIAACYIWSNSCLFGNKKSSETVVFVYVKSTNTIILN